MATLPGLPLNFAFIGSPQRKVKGKTKTNQVSPFKFCVMNTNLLIIYIRNSRDIYALTEWLQNALLKKVNRGLTPSVEYLANCSTMKKIVRMAAKMLSDQDHKTATKQEKEQAAREHAAYIIGCVEYLSKF